MLTKQFLNNKSTIAHYRNEGVRCVSYCMVCAYVREGNPRALASGLSSVYTHNHTVTALLQQRACACTLCIVRYLM